MQLRSDMQLCEHCGTAQPSASTFCGRCGATFLTHHEEDSIKTTSMRSNPGFATQMDANATDIYDPSYSLDLSRPIPRGQTNKTQAIPPGTPMQPLMQS